MPDEKPSRARGVDRVIDIFRQLHIARQPMAMRDLIEATGAPRSSVYELVNLLSEAGLVELDSDGAVFFGREMHYYGADYMAHNDLIRRSHQLMVEIVARHGETVQLCMLEGDKYTVVLSESNTHPFKITSDIGVRVPIPWTATGRLLLSNWSDSAILALIPKEDYRLANGKILDKQAFLEDIHRSGQQGYCLTEGLSESFTCCMAAPICSRSGQAVAAICFMVSRDTPEERRQMLLKELIDSGHKLSEFT
ncbi:IclR family transcriptional regulator [Klebsiella variicola]|uniref:IclR family transcriptional regulator n=2 Tax=Klebsiella variicola TaxID=244366 RepID=UPI0005B6150D|nr:IclR family transcriptional regulator [Klebsiella variicola]HCB0793892.1 IclR family transcriptional regulator [Klebsiella variicola subsp. variicola]EIW9274953.1 IclR family transcriptional regulator [Klebsiella variicola]ELC9130754.1 IclR family transcriptional regulator [Klebsiella variicola]MBG2047216.1 IclR family transcriptional regulator [Klebsiella variicola]MBR7370744.1 IclR family transcriptional regulator [Klebsiella variicola]